MWSLGVVESFYIFKYRKVQLLQRVIGFAVDFFFFEIFEETFTASIVKGISFLGEGLHDIKRIQ